MTEEDKQLIAEYMGWSYHQTDDKKWWNIIGKDGATHLLDSNDAALCVQEMQKRGEWEYFVGDIEDTLNFFAATYKRYHKEHHSYKAVLAAWLFNAENFFKAMSEWLKERGK